MSAHDQSSSDQAAGEHREGYDFAHPLPLPILFGVFFALLFLTIVTVAQASFELGRFEIPIVMAIATIKAALVMMFFMHVLYDKPFNAIVFLSAFVFLGLFMIITLNDSLMMFGDTIPVEDHMIPVNSDF